MLIENCEHRSVLHKELDRQFAVAIIDLFSVAPCMLWRQPVLFDPREYQNVLGAQLPVLPILYLIVYIQCCVGCAAVDDIVV